MINNVFNCKNMLNVSNINEVIMLWNKNDCKLVFDDKILDIIPNYDVNNQSIDQFLGFIYEEDKKAMENFLNNGFEEMHRNDKHIIQRYRIQIEDDIFALLFLGKIIWFNYKKLLLGNNYIIGNIKDEKKCSELFNDELKYLLEIEKLSSITRLDLVTGLYNTYFFKSLVSKYIDSARNKDKRAAMIIVDIDNFKYVNDSFGHDFGDLLLKKIGESILLEVLQEGLVSRYSGNTFLIFKPNIKDVNEVRSLCNNIAKSFDSPKIVQGKKIYLTASLGVALYPDHGIDFNTLLKNSDAAMYEAKENGKNECNFFDKRISLELNRVYSLQKGLRTAIENDELYVVFQPKVSLGDSLVKGFEALARWDSKEFGLVSPVEFIPIAESTKMIIPIGSFILEEVFKKIKCLLNERYDNFKIAVNLSEMQLREDVVVSDFKRLIKKYGINTKYIEVEITESMLMKSFDKNLKILKEIKKLGISVALDDFGTGYSSLNYLTKLPIDVLKIDRSFVIDLVTNPKSKCIVENIINLSHQLGIEVVAEGVEDKSQVEYLKGILCDVVQGYYYSKPRMFNQIKEIIGKEIL